VPAVVRRLIVIGVNREMKYLQSNLICHGKSLNISILILNSTAEGTTPDPSQNRSVS